MTHDVQNGFYDYKHTFCVELVPIVKDCLVCLEKGIAKQLGNMGRFLLCLSVSSVMTLIDPSSLHTSEVNAYGFSTHTPLLG